MAEKQYIEREAVLAEIEEAFRETDPTGEEQIGLLNGHRIVRIHPAADVAPVVHGKWKLHDNGDGTCDQCGFRQKYIWDYDNWQNYCGVCGADMRGGNHG